MHYFFVIIISLLTLNPVYSAQEIAWKNLPYKKSIKDNIQKGKIIVRSDMASFPKKKTQELNFSITGLHPKSCRTALRKLSLYEEYKNYLDIVTKSDYQESNKQISLTLSAKILPFDMIIQFTIPRINNTGQYSFKFTKGFLKNLTGLIHITKYKNQCLFYTKVYWSGPHTGINGGLFSFFSSSLAELAMRNLFRISSI